MTREAPLRLDDVVELLDRLDEQLGDQLGSLDDDALTGSSPGAQENRTVREARAGLARVRAHEARVMLAQTRERLEATRDALQRVQATPAPRPSSRRENDGRRASGGLDAAPAAPVACGGLSDPDRVAVLMETGLEARSDPRMDWYAQRVRDRLGVPTALVSLVLPEQQVFPGAVGLPEPHMTARRTPLTHSFCQYVATSGRPLVIDDARAHETVSGNPAIPQLGVIAYAGMPLTDGSGHVLGSLCAIDHEPRRWRAEELDVLADLAVGCSTELRLRMARGDAERERVARDRLQSSLLDSVERSQTLLDVSRSIGDSTSIEDVGAGLSARVGGVLGADYAALLVLDDRSDRLRLVAAPRVEVETALWSTLPLSERSPATLAVTERRAVPCPDRERFEAEFSADAGRRFRALGLHAVVAAPVLGRGGVVGALVLGWNRPREFSPADLLLVNTVSAYTARALEHVGWVQHRVVVAREMQQAMLTELPEIRGLRIAARYEPADAREYVGGDWYDVLQLSDPETPEDTLVALSVGDIVGHELDAAITMGQVRSMLRQAAWDHTGGALSRVAHAFETANAGLGLGAVGTAVLAQLRRRATDGGWSMSWLNLGHPAPIVVHPDGTQRQLDEHGRWFGLPQALIETRQEHHAVIPTGSLLVLYSDGVTDRPGHDPDERVAALSDLLARHADSDPDAVVDAVMDEFGTAVGDDVVVMAVRLG